MNGVEEMLRRQIESAPSLERLAFVLDVYLEAVEIIVKDGSESLALSGQQRAQLCRFGNLIIDIRPKEQCHNIAHFHLLLPDIDASFAIIDCTQIAGPRVPRTKMRMIKRFYDDGGRQRIIEFWNKMRPSDCPIGRIE